MKLRMKRALFALTLCVCMLLGTASVFADYPTDEILRYEVTADVNEDATVNLYYHLDWLVLESDGIGPVSWVNVGIPNNKYIELSPLSENIRSLAYSNGTAEVTFYDEYYEGEVISFDFLVISDYMYEINALSDGLTTYYFTPGWFDEIAVDELVIRWNSDRLDSWSGNCLIEGGYNVWETSLELGEKFAVQVNYANDAFSFSEGNQRSMLGSQDDYGDSYNDYYYEDEGGAIEAFFGMAIVGLFFWFIFRSIRNAFRSLSGFVAGGQTEKKVTRTKVVYFDSCPGCGAPRPEGKHVCPYCGRDLIKSEEVISEENVPAEDKEALKYKNKGEYHYSSDPNTFVRVNVVRVPVVHVSGGGTPRGGSSRGGGSSHGGGSSRSGGCAHSSCACACVSCACACACACAGGGRAGCSTKDFYKTDLKLSQLERKKNTRKTALPKHPAEKEQ